LCFLIAAELLLRFPSTAIAQEGWSVVNRDIWQFDPTSVCFLRDGQNGWAVGSLGNVMHTTNGGTTWSSQTSGTSSYLSSVFFTDASNGWVVGSGGTVIHTTNGGSSWNLQTSGTSNWLYGVFFTDASNGWAVGTYGTMLKYVGPRLAITDNTPAAGDGTPFGFLLAEGNISRDWNVKLKNSGRGSFSVQSCQSSNSAFSLVLPGLPQTLAPNQEKEFTVRFAPSQEKIYRDSLSFTIQGQDTSTVYRLRVSGGALLTTDPLVRALYQQSCAARDSALLYAPNSSAEHNALGVLCLLLHDANMASVDFASASGKGVEMNLATVSASEGKFTEAFSQWSTVFSASACPVKLKPQINFNRAWVYDEMDSLSQALTYYGRVIADTNASDRLKAKAYVGRGVTLAKQGNKVGAIADFQQAIVLDRYGAGVLAQQNISLTGVPSEPKDFLPLEFALEQNYPNPFNPSTTIEFALPSRAHVTLTLFNTLGQVVREVVNEEKEAGYYEVPFNAEGLASGVYFYRLKAGTFVETRKMVIVR